MKLTIIMATYNGARFIEEQIKSIQGQTVEDWSLIIRDDGSEDDTVNIIAMLAETDHRITLLKDGLGNLGVTQNFAQLMQFAIDGEADYVAISDQDDVWHSEKLQILLNEVKKIETADKVPVLIHTDLEVVDEAMCIIAHSFMDYAGIFPESLTLEHLICQNDVTGCSCLINRALLKLALPVPHGVPIHDWWLALLALSCGKIGYVALPLVRYRQHAGNVVGVKSNLVRVLRYFLNPGKWRQQIDGVRSSICQASLLIERLQNSGDYLCESGRLEVVNQYAKLLNVSRLQRMRIIRAHKIHKRSMFSDLFFKFSILTFPLSVVCQK